MSTAWPIEATDAPRRTQAAAWITRGIAEGMSGNAILDALKEAGIGYRRKDFYDDYRTTVVYQKGLHKVLTAQDDTVLGGSYATATPYDRSQAWTYVGGSSTFDRETGAKGVRYWGVSSDVVMTAGEVRGEFQRMSAEQQYDPDRIEYGDAWVSTVEFSRSRAGF